MVNKGQFKKTVRKHFSFLEKEGFESVVHETGIQYKYEDKEHKTRINLYFNVSRFPFTIRGFIVEKNISKVESIISRLDIQDINFNPYTIRVVCNDLFLTLSQTMLTMNQIHKEVIILDESDIEIVGNLIKNHYFDMIKQDFYSIDVDKINEGLLKCEDFIEYTITVFSPNGYYQFLRAYIISKIHNNNRYITWFENFLISSIIVDGNDEDKKILDYKDKIDKIILLKEYD
jgi:hypothetical protein